MQQAFEAFLREHDWSPKTRQAYSLWGRCYQRFLDSRGLPWQAARRRDLEDFHQQLLWTPNGKGGVQSANTIYQGLRLLRAFYGWAVEKGLASNHPLQGWILSRPPTPPRSTLTWQETLQLFRQPDLGLACGHRDLLLLHLLYQGLSYTQCRLLEVTSELSSDDTLQAVLRRYLSSARHHLVGPKEHSQLLVTDRGLPFQSNEGLRNRLRRYHPRLTPRILHQSHQAHRLEMDRRLQKFLM